jgi:hypothetical protein
MPPAAVAAMGLPIACISISSTMLIQFAGAAYYVTELSLDTSKLPQPKEGEEPKLAMKLEDMVFQPKKTNFFGLSYKCPPFKLSEVSLTTPKDTTHTFINLKANGQFYFVVMGDIANRKIRKAFEGLSVKYEPEGAAKDATDTKDPSTGTSEVSS